MHIEAMAPEPTSLEMFLTAWPALRSPGLTGVEIQPTLYGVGGLAVYICNVQSRMFFFMVFGLNPKYFTAW